MKKTWQEKEITDIVTREGKPAINFHSTEEKAKKDYE